ncbi:ATP-binding cassette domain-containing protein [Micromonospora sp. NPDC049175]|uniref:ABC transporter ATP-binding protein n=1 Tax=Micromonospora sp. NPDC049175 TaxID=3364266 RepID=UPI00371CF046
MAISIDRLTLGYGDHLVVADFGLDVRPREAVALRGPNGAGKSTLLRCVAGLHAPRAGTVTVAGLPVDERDAGFRRAVVAMLDDVAWYPSLTVREHVDLVRLLNPADTGAWWDPVELLDLLALTTVADDSPVRLSSGQRQRLTLAMAFARPSRVLLLDEPERHLDAAGRQTVIDLVRAYLDRDGAALIATHDPDLAETCRVVEVTGPEHPRHPR